ncbi:MAG: trypsin-like peptidase domain-containing protein [Acidobacteria bacterium]|nr:trypsin-like peptidase domain-containing protein [Acidobacteriota bacterium]
MQHSLIRIFGLNGKIFGTGWLASERRAMTCVHVIADALNLDRRISERPDTEIKLDFPFVAPGQQLRARVAVNGWHRMRSQNGEQPDGDEDIALLEILDPPPNGCRAAPLATTDAVNHDHFHTLGFSTPKGQPAEGRVKGAIVGGCVAIEDPQGKGYFVAEGFSGAPVWNQWQTAVIGMIVRRDYGAERTAYMIPVSQLQRVTASAPPMVAHEPARLICHLAPAAGARNKFRLQTWMWRDGNFVQLGDPEEKPLSWLKLEKELAARISIAQADAADLTVELVLPRKLFHQELPQAWLEQLPLVWRCEKRFAARRRQIAFNGSRLQFLQQEERRKQGGRLVLLDDWQRNSAHLRREASSVAAPALVALAIDHAEKKLRPRLRNQSQAFFVACGFKPSSESETAPLCLALDFGAPLAVWFREWNREWNNGQPLDEAQLRATLQLDDSVTLGELPRHLWQLQNAASDADNREHPHYHLIVLHDDYDRVPH